MKMDNPAALEASGFAEGSRVSVKIKMGDYEEGTPTLKKAPIVELGVRPFAPF